MKKLAIITNGTLPLPSTKGGAVESLLQTFIDKNETSNDFQLVVFTVSHNKAIELSKSYQNTKFIFIKSESSLFKLGRGIRFIVNKLRKNSIKNQFIHEVLKFKNQFEGADLILIENNITFVSYIRRITKKPLGLHLHNDYLNIDNEADSKKILQNLDFVLGVSKYIKDRVKEIAPKSCKVDFVYNGINLDRFGNVNLQIEKNKFRENYNISKEEIVILFAGRLQETKGIKLLMEAFIEINDKYNAKLLIVGSSGFEDSKKSSFIKELELLSHTIPNKIVFTGYIKYSQIHIIYGLADFAVLPSLCEEALGLTAVEALASGLPVIVTDAGGMPETVSEKCGFILKRDSLLKQNLVKKMEQLIVNKDLKETMGIEAKKRALLFSDKNYYKSLSDYLKSVI
ncbi:MAG TPA: glycosyltransferase family 1 protein [Lutibacter sp.]|nr:glycosyltransferase family 1 protein [Lutibacter sp.]